MAQRLFVPRLIAAQPWQVILPLFALTLFGGAVLYSAAGGHMRPWALMLVIATAEDYIADMLTALRA